jgi:hypothetical protein
LALCCAQAALGSAFIVEGLLFAFHLEGSELNWKAHLLLVISIFSAAAAILAELRYPASALLGVVRAQLVLLQGVWFMQIAKLLFEGALRLTHCPCHTSGSSSTTLMEAGVRG